MDEIKGKVIKQLLDKNNKENIILYNEQGKAFEFEQIVIVQLKDIKNMVFPILMPVTKIEGVGDGEAIVFELHKREYALRICQDKNLIARVFEKSQKM